METIFKRLTEELLAVNNELSAEAARTWVEGLWEDFETTRAKAGREYKGQEVTEQIVLKWIKQYGPHLHKYAPKQEKFAHLNQENQPKN
ncbi:YfhJ family protein [Alkalihalophilus marmarensis]|uniref:YfhJ family protein n=1 Tax=Alkalihalophilus marmarensis TaxID=521377 RepID=UPI002E1BAAFD|nr:YfhJ family protein [Alkalihalophilus marmarensis]